MTTPTGRSIAAFGWIRYNILSLINSLLTLKYTAVNIALDKTDIFPIAIDLMFEYEHNSFCHQIVEKISIAMLEQFDTDLVESFLKKTNLPIRILDAEKKFRNEEKSAINKRKEYMPILYNLADKIDFQMENFTFIRDYVKGRESEWDGLLTALRGQKQKLKDTEILADKSAPRGKVIVEDEEGFKTNDTLLGDDNEQSIKTPTVAFSPRKMKISEITDEDLLDDEKLLSAGYNLNDLDFNDVNDVDEVDALSELLGSDDVEDKGSMMSAIDAILNGSYDSIVNDKSKLQDLTLEDILKDDM
eukprot:TRINITY_DN2199_c0_g1_i1.p1 TRINITY_DN2199_c0_g1~~TRINITY_DN2199_c0_g1_i1.p1  ORF type:complete len:315 (+),score=63.07 TRINITY_DN2199_c0_g1_i1:40-945(+)